MWNSIIRILKLIFLFQNKYQQGKKPWLSKTIWINILAIIGIILTQYCDIDLSVEDSTILLSTVNIILRFITKDPVGLYEDEVK